MPLLSSLIAGRKYCVEFYVCLTDFSEKAISNIGAYFSVDSLLDATNNQAINYVLPQIENPALNIINDKINWILISENFIANGGERFMTIGNFHDSSTTNVQNVVGHWQGAEYNIDDISVIDCTGQGINESSNPETLQIYPNPSSNKLTIELKNIKPQSIKVVSILGECIQQLTTSNQQLTMDIANLPNGIYFMEVFTEKGILRKKFVKE